MHIGIVYPYYFKKGPQMFQEKLSEISPDISFKKLVVPDRENLLSGARFLEENCDVVVLFEIFEDEEELKEFENSLISFYSGFRGMVFRCFVFDEREVEKFIEFFTNFYFYPEKLEHESQKKSFNFF